MAKAAAGPQPSASQHTQANNLTRVLRPRASKIVKKKASRKKDLQHQRRPSHFRLLDLPPELVDIVYTQMLHAGHTNILRTSKQVSSRALQILKREGVFKIMAQDMSGIIEYCIKSTEGALFDLGKIRNYELHLVSHSLLTPHHLPLNQLRFGNYRRRRDGHWRSHYFQPEFELTNSRVHGSNCHVNFQIDLIRGLSGGAKKQLFVMLRHLTGFAKLSFAYEAKPHIMVAERELPPLNEAEQQLQFNFIRQELETVLGPVVSISGDKDTRRGVIFYPLNHQASLTAQNNQKDEA